MPPPVSGVTRAAIVLGAAVWEGPRPSPALARRIDTAARLFEAGRVDLIVATGGIGRVPPAEARVIADALATRGIPETAILIEDHSENTLENLRNAFTLLPEGIVCTIVTDAYHLPRARLIARRLGRPCQGAAPSLKGASIPRLIRQILRELPALLWYGIRRLR